MHHCCNSAATLRFPEMYLDMVRAGVILYGLSPALECDGLANLHPVMNFYSTITLVKEVEAGIQVSYGRTYTAPEQRKLATIAVGYADGFRRNFSNLGHVIVQGQYAPIVGRVCMDQTLIDVTGIPDVTMGDRVILVGQEGNCSITFDQFAQLNGTINYEEICLIGRRVPRVYLKDGREFGITDYLLQPIEKNPSKILPLTYNKLRVAIVSKSNGEIIGHILFTKAKVGESIQLALAPLSVLPDYQRQGIGTALIKAGHKKAAELGYGYSIVLGSEKYYPKMGYLPAETYGITSPFDVPSENFMAYPLRKDIPNISGVIQYAKEFGID